jgi:CubicO group peptidase (beta-lactamase class C family)
MGARRIAAGIGTVVAMGLGTGLLSGQANLENVDALVRETMELWDVPGVALAVVQGDSVVLARGWGVTDVDNPEPISEHTLFGIMSTTKAFTSTAIAMLVDEGKLSWDDRVHDLLPDFVLPDPWATREFTVRDLLAHRNGLERGDFLWFGSGFSRAEIVRRQRYMEEVGPFRSTYGYSNNMYITAGVLIEAVTGVTWDDFVDQRIFTPLGMEATNTSVDELIDAGVVAMPHEELEGTLTAIAYRSLDNEAPGGSINSTAREMAEWIRLQLAVGIHGADTLVSSVSLRETRTPQTPIPFSDEALVTNPGMHFLAYAMGWTVQDYRGALLVQHSGGIDGLRSRVALLPEHNLGLVVLTNKGQHNAAFDVIRNHILDAYLGGSEDWNTIYLELDKRARDDERAVLEERDQDRVQGTRPSLELREYVGRYTNRGFGEAVVRLENGSLVARFGPSIVGDLKHWHYNTFLATWRNPYLGSSLVTFDLGADGRPVLLDNANWWPDYERVNVTPPDQTPSNHGTSFES